MFSSVLEFNDVLAVAIERSRELLGSELAALVGESYERAYGDMVRVQQLTELEEVIRYQQSFSGAVESTFYRKGGGSPVLKRCSHCSGRKNGCMPIFIFGCNKRHVLVEKVGGS